MSSSKEKIERSSGQMSAVIRGREKKFHASTISYLSEHAVFAVDDNAIGNEPFIYFRLPENPEAKSYDIEPLEANRVWAHLGIEGAGYAESGQLTIETLGSSGEPKKASFKFKGRNDSFSVTQGTFEIDSVVNKQAMTEFRAAKARVSPALEGNSGFNADDIWLYYNSVGELTGVHVSQRHDLAGDLGIFGAFFQFTADGVTSYLAAVNNMLYAGRPSGESEPISNFKYKSGESLLIEFNFEFTWSGRTYVLSKGRVELDLRPK
ncbi:hypothetical protein [Pseudomonas sp. LLC-1]|uniref:hypothetical protein n=1 Tax=Pseudomonas sp. LLC-1 TaxID=1812180 RepID=UPI0011B850A2|nr:hypothetical protein [Pseudomonas sp. LLC-1]